MGRTIVTTSHKPDDKTLVMARQASCILEADFVNRERLPLEQLRDKYNAENILVINRGQIKLHTRAGEYFFHPSMSVPRVKAIREGKPDHMVQAMDLKEGDTVLDCTLGLGADAIVAAFVAGPSGRVVGVEKSPELAYVVKYGMAHYSEGGSKPVREAMARVDVCCADSEGFLRELPDNSFDVVYFDPMFRYPRRKSSSMQPLRTVVETAPLNRLMISEALRVARQRVVMKENSFSKEFARLGFTQIYGGKNSPVAFGVIGKEAGI